KTDAGELSQYPIDHDCPNNEMVYSIWAVLCYTYGKIEDLNIKYFPADQCGKKLCHIGCIDMVTLSGVFADVIYDYHYVRKPCYIGCMAMVSLQCVLFGVF
ncbi:unnamed protein product, partial [Meganyctiphanes norvegica]